MSIELLYSRDVLDQMADALNGCCNTVPESWVFSVDGSLRIRRAASQYQFTGNGAKVRTSDTKYFGLPWAIDPSLSDEVDFLLIVTK